jgi:TolB protein
MKRFTAAIVLAASAVVISAPPASATYPGENGWIAFRKILVPGYDRGEDYTRGAILIVRPDGTGQRRVTYPPQGVITTQPDWSPNGRWIAYQRKTVDGHWRIYRIRRNGTDRQNLSKQTCPPETCLEEFTPAWSPNGRRIAYVHFQLKPKPVTVISIMRADGRHRVQVTAPAHPETGTGDFCPQWSPSGKRLVFERFRGDKQKSAVFTVRLDGTGLRRLTPWWMDAGEFPDWSPNGRWILFLNHSTQDVPSSLWLVHPNGEGRHRITTTSGGTFTWLSGSFSPDGTMITAGGTPWVGGRSDVYTMNADGSGFQNVTQSVRWDSEPDWGPRRK